MSIGILASIVQSVVYGVKSVEVGVFLLRKSCHHQDYLRSKVFILSFSGERIHWSPLLFILYPTIQLFKFWVNITNDGTQNIAHLDNLKPLQCQEEHLVGTWLLIDDSLLLRIIVINTLVFHLTGPLIWMTSSIYWTELDIPQ